MFLRGKITEIALFNIKNGFFEVFKMKKPTEIAIFEVKNWFLLRFLRFKNDRNRNFRG